MSTSARLYCQSIVCSLYARPYPDSLIAEKSQSKYPQSDAEPLRAILQRPLRLKNSGHTLSISKATKIKEPLITHNSQLLMYILAAVWTFFSLSALFLLVHM